MPLPLQRRAAGIDEGPDNYNCISYSDDDGLTWVNDYLIINHPDYVRLHEPILWVDPAGTLWHFWAQSYVYWDSRGGVWASKCIDPAAKYPRWTEPRRLCDGVMACKPIVRRDGGGSSRFQSGTIFPPALTTPAVRNRRSTPPTMVEKR